MEYSLQQSWAAFSMQIGDAVEPRTCSVLSVPGFLFFDVPFKVQSNPAHTDHVTSCCYICLPQIPVVQNSLERVQGFLHLYFNEVFST